MIAVIQRAASASVVADGVQAGKCEKGLFVLLGVVDGDCEKDAEVLSAKVSKLRIFTDENDKMNLSVKDISGSVLVVSNFTLGADVSHGNRPSFTPAAHPSVAEPLYEYFCKCLENEGVPVEKGVFGAHMDVTLLNDGPVTIILEK